MILSAEHLNYAYRYESDANVRERILFVRRVMIDKEEAAGVAELELHRSGRGWAYKWLKRFANECSESLKDRHRRYSLIYLKKSW